MNIRECIRKTQECLVYYFTGKKIKISLGGVAKSGKTSFSKSFTDKKVLKKEKPTLGTYTRLFFKNGVRGMLIDIGGSEAYSNLMDYTYRNSDAHFFFVNASSPQEFLSSKRMFEGLIKRNQAINIPILILCTHNDINGFKTCQEIALEMGLDRFIGKDIGCYSISSLTRSNFTAIEEWIGRRAK